MTAIICVEIRMYNNVYDLTIDTLMTMHYI